MKEPKQIPPSGTKLKVTNLHSTVGWLIAKKHIKRRRTGEIVTMGGYVPGHGGDVLWCKHDNGDVSVYSWKELEFDLRASVR